MSPERGISVASGPQETCPACGSGNTEWFIMLEQNKSPFRKRFPLLARASDRLKLRSRLWLRTAGWFGRRRTRVHHELWDTYFWGAETYVCLDCEAGWMENIGKPVHWIRPWHIS